MFWTLLIVLFSLILFHQFYWRRRKLPPGPLPLPVLGNIIPVIKHSPGYKPYQEWKDTYGSVYTYWLGPYPVVTVNDYETIQDIFVNDGENYADRALFGSLGTEFRGGNWGIIDTSGYLWKEQRRFTLHTLRDIGLGKEQMQERILLEAQWLMETLEEEGMNGPLNPLKYMDRTVVSVINVVLFGYRFDESTVHEFQQVRSMMDRQNKELNNPALIAFFDKKWARENLPWVKGKYQLLLETRDTLYAFFAKNIQRHRDEIDYDSEECNDFCDAYLKEMHKRKDDVDTTFHDKQLENLCVDLWLAGMETTAATMSWGVVLLLNHQEVLKAMHEEFDRVIGEDRFITTKDKTKLPYANAVITEVQRWANILPQNLLRKTLKEVVIGGHVIPAGTAVSPQISMLLFDPVEFPDPFKFDPKRHLDDKGNLAISKYFLPFSVGKRQCPGEGLARMELFLFFTNIAHRFELTPIDEANPPSLERTLQAAGRPIPFECNMKRRRIQKTQ